MRLIFLLFLLIIYEIRSEETVEEIDDGHSSTGEILRKQEGYAQSASQGGTLAFFRSRPRVAAVRTFNEAYIGGDRTPRLRTTIHDGNYDHDLHTAYRLPLQRLSDHQLSMILKKHSPDDDATSHMSRAEMINKVQEQIVQKNAKRLMRPTLLTNINVLPEEVTIDNEPVANPKTHQRTTVASILSSTSSPKRKIPQIIKAQKGEIRRSQKNIPELEAEEQQHPTVQHHQSERLRQLSTKLRHVKAKYDAMKIQYLHRLREINDRKINLAIKTKPIPATTTTTTTTTEDPTTTIEPSVREFFEDDPKEIIIPSSPLIDNEPFNSQEEVVEAHIIVPTIPRKVITTEFSTLIDNEPESAEITSTPNTHLIDNEPEEATTTTQTSVTSKSDWEQTMINKLRKIVEKAKAQQYRIHEKTEEFQQGTTTTPQPPQLNNFPIAHAIPRQYGSKVIKQEAAVSVAGLHDGGNNSGEAEFEEATTTELPPKGMVDNESHIGQPSSNGFKFAMKKVGDISTTELLTQLSDELKTAEEESESIPTTTTEAPTTTELVTETTTEEEASTSQIIESDDNQEEEKELDLFAQSDEEAICDAISCDFEKGDLCQWEASQDELSPSSPHYRRLHRRAHFIRRSWHNWQGRYRNRVTGIARAQMFSFSNQRFAASYVRPFQRSTLTGMLLSGEQETIRFRAWEATRNVQLKVCCDSTDNCVFETEIGVYRGSRRWREHTATCPKRTSKIIFECINHGIYQGACGLDNIHLMNAYCPQVIPITGLHDSERRRKLKHLL